MTEELTPAWEWAIKLLPGIRKRARKMSRAAELCGMTIEDLVAEGQLGIVENFEYIKKKYGQGAINPGFLLGRARFSMLSVIQRHHPAGYTMGVLTHALHKIRQANPGVEITADDVPETSNTLRDLKKRFHEVYDFTLCSTDAIVADLEMNANQADFMAVVRTDVDTMDERQFHDILIERVNRMPELERTVLRMYFDPGSKLTINGCITRVASQSARSKSDVSRAALSGLILLTEAVGCELTARTGILVPDHIRPIPPSQYKYVTADQRRRRRLNSQVVKVRPVDGYRSVCFNRQSGRYKAAFTHRGRTHYVGQFDTEIDAAIAVDASRVQVMGIDQARPYLNFPENDQQYLKQALDAPVTAVKPKRIPTSKFNYVSFSSRQNKFRGYTWWNNRRYATAWCRDERDAAIAVDALRISLMGYEQARSKLNYPDLARDAS